MSRDVSDLLAFEREVPGPDDTTRQRMGRRVRASAIAGGLLSSGVAVGTAGAAGAVAASGAVAAGTSGAASAGALTKVIIAGVASVGVGTGAGVAVHHVTNDPLAIQAAAPERDALPAPDPRPAPFPRILSEDLVHPEPVERGAARTESKEPEPERPSILSEDSRVARTESKDTPRPPRPEPPPMPGRTLADERALLDDALQFLAHGDASAAVTRLRDHAARFDRGELAEEREVLWIRALESQAEAAATIERIERFLRAFPRSPHRASLEQRLQRWRETETGPRPEWQ